MSPSSGHAGIPLVQPETASLDSNGSEDLDHADGFKAVNFSYGDQGDGASATVTGTAAPEGAGSEDRSQEIYQPGFAVPEQLRLLLRGVTDRGHKACAYLLISTHAVFQLQHASYDACRRRDRGNENVRVMCHLPRTLV